MNVSTKLALLALAPLSLVAAKVWVCPGACPFGTCGASDAAASEVAADGSVVSRSSAITGRYVEARSASVYAGACHYGAESTTAGREAVLAWQLDGGSYEGFPLDGVELIAAVRADVNLAERDAARSSVVYLDEDLPMPKRAAALAWLKREHGAALGTIESVRTAQVEVSCDGDAYHVRAGDWVRLEGQAMPDRACCTMPSNVWYKPMVALEGRLVGESVLFAVDDPALGPPFERRAENDAFLGSLAAPAPACARTCSPRPLCCGDEPILDTP
jgi:Protein of unknown function (DUF1326)